MFEKIIASLFLLFFLFWIAQKTEMGQLLREIKN